jgi:hypothetical protein
MPKNAADTPAKKGEEEVEELLTLDLEERRARNIARRDKFLADLFATFTQVQEVQTDEDNAVSLFSPMKNEHDSHAKHVNEQTMATILSLFPSFHSQLQTISGFIDTVRIASSSSFSFPAMWIGGPLSLIEKRHLLISVFSVKSVLYVHINFEGIQTIAEFLRLLISKLFDNLNSFLDDRKERTGLGSSGLSYIQKLKGLFAHCRDIADFATNLGLLYNELKTRKCYHNGVEYSLSLFFIFENISSLGNLLPDRSSLSEDLRITLPKVFYL